MQNFHACCIEKGKKMFHSFLGRQQPWSQMSYSENKSLTFKADSQRYNYLVNYHRNETPNTVANK